MSGTQVSTDIRQGGSPATTHDDPAQDAPAVAPIYDADDAALAEARRLADLEDGVDAGAVTPPEADPGRRQRPISVPKARLDEALQAAQQARADAEAWRNRATYMEGALAARAQQPPPAVAPQPAPQPAAPSVEQTILAEQARKLEAAEKFDRGEITAADLERVRIQADNVIQALRDRQQAATLRAAIPIPQVGLADAAHMNAVTVELEQQHPWCMELRDAEFAHLEAIATDTLAKMGQPVNPGSLQDALRVRHFVAQMSDVFGPWFFPERIATVQARHAQAQQAAQQAAASQPQQTSATSARAQPSFAARYAAHPPQLTGVGSAGEPQNVTEDQIAQMSTEEIAALPASVRARLLN